MSCRPSKSGFSLVEAVIASFILLSAILMSVSLFDKTLQAEVSNEERVVALLVAESALAEVRETANTDFSSLRSLHNGRTYRSTDFPGFEVVVSVESKELANPCSTLERQYDSSDPFAEGRLLRKSAWSVEVQVNWSDRGTSRLKLHEMMVDYRPADDFHLVITSRTGTPIGEDEVIELASRGERTFKVQALSRGERVRDLRYTWYVEALTGIGSVKKVSRNGRRCVYFNGYRTYLGEVKDSPGACRLVVEAHYQGVLAKDTVRINNVE